MKKLMFWKRAPSRSLLRSVIYIYVAFGTGFWVFPLAFYFMAREGAWMDALHVVSVLSLFFIFIMPFKRWIDSTSWSIDLELFTD